MVAKTLLYGRFGLAELTPAALSDSATRNLTARVICRNDPQMRFPCVYSGGVTVVLGLDESRVESALEAVMDPEPRSLRSIMQALLAPIR